MPKEPAHNTIARQWELLKLLPPRGPGMTATELTDKIHDAGFSSVTKRTVERDLVELEGAFGIRCNNVSKPYGWHWMEGRSFDIPGLEVTDALSLVLVEDLLSKLAPAPLRQVLESKFQQAHKKLSSIRKNRYSEWVNRARYVAPSLPFLPPPIPTRVLETVQEGILQERQIQVSYTGAEDAKSRDFTLHPLGFVQRGPVAYLVATVSGYTNVRLFALHRMNSVKMTAEHSESPEGFSLDDYLEQGGLEFGSGGMIGLKVEVSNKLACYLAESPLTKDQKLTSLDKDRHVLTATIKDSWQLQFWLLSQGAEITVEEPMELRERIQRSLQAALEGYGDTERCSRRSSVE